MSALIGLARKRLRNSGHQSINPIIKNLILAKNHAIRAANESV
jgi:hypothetical protein